MSDKIAQILKDTQHKAPTRALAVGEGFASGRKAITDKYGFNSPSVPASARARGKFDSISADIENIGVIGQKSGKTN